MQTLAKSASNATMFIKNVFTHIDPAKANLIIVNEDYAVNFFDEATKHVDASNGEAGKTALQLTFMVYLLHESKLIDMDEAKQLITNTTDIETAKVTATTLVSKFAGQRFSMLSIGTAIHVIACMLVELVELAVNADEDKLAMIECELALCKKFLADVNMPRA